LGRVVNIHIQTQYLPILIKFEIIHTQNKWVLSNEYG
jgi:hypothetical protein